MGREIDRLLDTCIILRDDQCADAVDYYESRIKKACNNYALCENNYLDRLPDRYADVASLGAFVERDEFEKLRRLADGRPVSFSDFQVDDLLSFCKPTKDPACIDLALRYRVQMENYCTWSPRDTTDFFKYDRCQRNTLAHFPNAYSFYLRDAGIDEKHFRILQAVREGAALDVFPFGNSGIDTEIYRHTDIREADDLLQRISARISPESISEAGITSWLSDLGAYADIFVQSLRHSGSKTEESKYVSALNTALLKQALWLQDAGCDAASTHCNRLRHFVSIALGALGVVRANWNWAHPFQDLSDKLYADGVLDDTERRILQVMRRLDRMPFGVTDGMLFFLEQGFRFPEGPKEVNLSPSPYKLFANRGFGDFQKAIKSKKLSSSDRRLRGRYMDGVCYDFALGRRIGSDDIFWRDYRPVDLGHEKARAGDVIAYFNMVTDPELWSVDRTNREHLITNPFLQVRHMGVVDAIDDDGFPLKVLSKIGGSRSVIAHRPDEIWIGYGFLWGVFRQRN